MTIAKAREQIARGEPFKRLDLDTLDTEDDEGSD